jgi:hypothetical protein
MRPLSRQFDIPALKCKPLASLQVLGFLRTKRIYCSCRDLRLKKSWIRFYLHESGKKVDNSGGNLYLRLRQQDLTSLTYRFVGQNAGHQVAFYSKMQIKFDSLKYFLMEKHVTFQLFLIMDTQKPQIFLSI